MPDNFQNSRGTYLGTFFVPNPKYVPTSYFQEALNLIGLSTTEELYDDIRLTLF